MWVAEPPSNGFADVFNGVNGVLHIKYADRGMKRKKTGTRNDCGRNAWSNVCKLDAVIDYSLLSLTARHMETVTVFRYSHTNMLRRISVFVRECPSISTPRCVVFHLLLSPFLFFLHFLFLLLFPYLISPRLMDCTFNCFPSF